MACLGEGAVSACALYFWMEKVLLDPLAVHNRLSTRSLFTVLPSRTLPALWAAHSMHDTHLHRAPILPGVRLGCHAWYARPFRWSWGHHCALTIPEGGLSCAVGRRLPLPSPTLSRVSPVGSLGTIDCVALSPTNNFKKVQIFGSSFLRDEAPKLARVS